MQDTNTLPDSAIQCGNALKAALAALAPHVGARRAAPEGGIERHLQQAAGGVPRDVAVAAAAAGLDASASSSSDSDSSSSSDSNSDSDDDGAPNVPAGRQHVTEWSERHTAPHFQTDLWFIVTDENGTETRVPACRAILNINCLFLHSFQAGDDVEIPQTICTDALTLVYFLWLNYPRLPEAESPFDKLVSVTSSTYGTSLRNYDENKMVELCVAIPKLAKLADWIQCDATIERLEDIMESNILKRVPLREGTASKYLYMASFALSDAQNEDGTTYLEDHDTDLVDEFPAALIRMNEAERERIADHVAPMFEALLEGCSIRIRGLDATGDISERYKDAEALSGELKLLVTVAKFLLNSYKEARSGPASS